jgi:hypothetical protein
MHFRFFAKEYNSEFRNHNSTVELDRKAKRIRII